VCEFPIQLLLLGGLLRSSPLLLLRLRLRLRICLLWPERGGGEQVLLHGPAEGALVETVLAPREVQRSTTQYDAAQRQSV
jgi:hypothetical protein